MSFRLMVIAAVVAVLSPAAGADVLHVDDDAPPGGDGLSWATAYRFLRDAVAVAEASGGAVTEIHVAQGTYTPDRDEANPDPPLSNCCWANDGQGCDDADCEAAVCAIYPYCCDTEWDWNCAFSATVACDACTYRDMVFQLINGVALMGGYAGLGTDDPDERNTALFETILSGDLSGDDGPVFQNNGENAYHVVTGGGTDATAVLDGVTVTAGNADGNSDASHPGRGVGGGMYNGTGNPTVTNCAFRGNSAGGGGGMFNRDSSGPTVADCTFSGNEANDGGGMYNAYYSSPTVTNCRFEENAAHGLFADGGGMTNRNYCSPTVTNCEFSGNTTDGWGGGMENDFHSNPMVTNCAFNGNSAAGWGGGIDNEGRSSPTVINCIFGGNAAGDWGGGIANDYYSSPCVTNCAFIGNTAGDGGGMYNRHYCSPTVTNCTFAGNVADDGGGMFNDLSSATIANCVLWGNTQDEIYGAAVVAYSDVQGGWPGGGNVDADPLFVDPVNGDYRLQAGSPCIDAGHNWAIAGLADSDLDGNPRFADGPADDTGCGIPVVVDMGAYEYQGEPFPVRLGDIDGSGAVDFADFLLLLDDWGACQADCCLADLDLDGSVGVTDFLVLLASWGP